MQNGFTFGMPTYYSNFHLGIDKVCPEGTAGYAPTAGKIESVVTGVEGGLTLWFRDSNNKVWRFMHLSKTFIVRGQAVSEGTHIFNTGNTGKYVGNTPHLHTDVSNNNVILNNIHNFIDPDLYLKEHTMTYKPNTIVFSKADAEYYWVKSDGRLLFIPHDRLSLAIAMQVGVTVEESLKNQTIGNF